MHALALEFNLVMAAVVITLPLPTQEEALFGLQIHQYEPLPQICLRYVIVLPKLLYPSKHPFKRPIPEHLFTMHCSGLNVIVAPLFLYLLNVLLEVEASDPPISFGHGHEVEGLQFAVLQLNIFMPQPEPVCHSGKRQLVYYEAGDTSAAVVTPELSGLDLDSRILQFILHDCSLFEYLLIYQLFFHFFIMRDDMGPLVYCVHLADAVEVENTPLGILTNILAVHLSEFLPFMKACIDLANSPEHNHMHNSLPLFPR